ncbi:Pleckstrin homology domain, partial [Rhizoctonia solani]
MTGNTDLEDSQPRLTANHNETPAQLLMDDDARGSNRVSGMADVDSRSDDGDITGIYDTSVGGGTRGGADIDAVEHALDHIESRPAHTRTGSEFDPDARNSEPSPDVNLDLSSVEDAAGDGAILTRDYVHPLAAAQLAPGKILVSGQIQGQIGKTASVRSRGRVPDALEVLPLDEHVSTRTRRRAIPHSSYYSGPPGLDSAYGSDPVAQIGVHYPREILRIERDYSGGELCQFHPTFPLELEGRITPVQHQESMNSINEVLISAHSLLPSFVYNSVAILTLYVSTLFVSSHYDKEMQRLRLLIDQLNREVYNPQGLNILWPQRTAFLFGVGRSAMTTAPYDPSRGVAALAHASHLSAGIPEAAVPNDILCRGWMLKKRRKKMQGYARRYFVLTNSGVLSYSFDPKSPTRDSILLRHASLSSSERRRDIHIDSGTSTFHVRALTQDDFSLWIGSCRKFVNISGEIEHEEPLPAEGAGTGAKAGHTRSYSRSMSLGIMSDQRKALGLLGEMSKVQQTLHDLEEAIAMVKEDDSKKKHHNSTKSKKDKEVKEKEKEKEGLFGLFSGSHKKSSTPTMTIEPLSPPPVSEDGTLVGATPRVSFAGSVASAPSTVHSYLTSTIQTLKTQHSALTTLLEARNITPIPNRTASPLMGAAIDLSRSRSVSRVSRHSMASEVTSQMWFDASDGADEFFLDADESESGAIRAVSEKHSDVESDEECEDVVDEESSEDEPEPEPAPTLESDVSAIPSTAVVRRTKLPAPNTGEEGSLFAVLKKNVGKDLSTVSLAEDVEYTNLLDEAVAASDPVDRIALVTAFAVSGYACTLHRASRKPFNPMLGETFEDIRLGFIAEKVSHHPPIMACHAHGEGWEFWCTSGAKNKFWGKSLEIIPMGAAYVRIGDEVYSWQKPSSFMRNLIAGNRYLEHVGPMSITSTAGHRCDLDFKEGGFWGSTLNHVGGSILSPDSKIVSKIEGTWHEGLSQHLDTKGSHLKVLWRPNPFPPFADQYYGFTGFTITLNELTPDLVGVVPPTDSRLRPDQRAMEEGRIDDADRLKIQLEEGQRARRRAREEAGEEWKPQWFEQGTDGEWKYKGGYWETRKTGKWSSVQLW